MRTALGTIYTDEDFADLFPKEDQPVEAPWQLALVMVMQFVENLPDRQTADACNIGARYVFDEMRRKLGILQAHCTEQGKCIVQTKNARR